jgi:hypothetical protein
VKVPAQKPPGPVKYLMTTADRSETWVFTPTPAVRYVPLVDMAHGQKRDDDRPA